MKEVLRLYEEKGTQEGLAQLKEEFASKRIRPQDIDLGRLFAECFGWQNFMECRAGNQLATDVMRQALTESTGAVSTAAFLNVSGQFAYQTVMDAYEMEPGAFTALIPEANASTLDGEKIPGITHIGDDFDFRNESDPYPLVGVGEDWLFTPTIRDRGAVLPITWEALFNDKTGQLNEQAGKMGEWFKVRREKAAIDCVVDENVTSHRYNWRGTVIASYGDNSGSHTWDNLAASNGLVDWTDIDAAEQVFNGLTDPYTGEPVPYEPRHLIVTKQNEQTARRIVSATEITLHAGGYATSGNLSATKWNNPYLNKFEIVTSRLLASRLATDTDWFLGDVSKYAKCMMAEKMNVIQAPPNNHDEFHRRIVTQHRVNERFAYVVVQPRSMVKSTA